MKSWTVFWLSLKTKVEPGRRESRVMSGDWRRLHWVRGVCSGSPENHWITRLSHKTEAEDTTRRCVHPGRFNHTGGAVWPPGSLPPRSFEAEDACRDRKAWVEVEQGCGRWAFVQWRKSEDFQIRPWGACIPSYLVRVVSSFGCLHINNRGDGWQPTIGTLAH
jgi:hypothetical protein